MMIMMMMSALYYTNTLIWNLKQQSIDNYLTPIGHIFLPPNQLVFGFTP